MFEISAARSEPTVSSTAGMSAMNSSSVGSEAVGIGSDRPVPRLSNMISRPNVAKRSRRLGQRRHVPLGIEIAEPLVEQQDVGRPVADDLIREVEVAQSGVPRFRDHLLQG